GNEMVFGMIEVGGKLVLEGWNGGDIGINMVEQICERDPNKGIVECICGTKEDDGDRGTVIGSCQWYQLASEGPVGAFNGGAFTDCLLSVMKRRKNTLTHPLFNEVRELVLAKRLGEGRLMV
ncbi:PHD finger protein male sterility 1-like, partial [Trifolium pratense]